MSMVSRATYFLGASVSLSQAEASAGLAPGEFISTNDALCALLWHLMCSLRGRTIPDSGDQTSHGSIITVVNLRQLLPALPPRSFLNANGPLYVSGADFSSPMSTSAIVASQEAFSSSARMANSMQ
jgi:hypothetical protein